MSSGLPLARPSSHLSLLPLPSRSLRSSFSTLRPLQSGSPLFNLTGLANSRESQHFSRERRIPRTEFSPQLQLLRASEVDPFAPAPGASRGAVEAAAAKALAKTQSQALDVGKEGAHRKKVLSDFWGNQIDTGSSEDLGAGGRKDEGIKMATLASEVRPYARDGLSSSPRPSNPSSKSSLPAAPPPSSSPSSTSLSDLTTQLQSLSSRIQHLESALAHQQQIFEERSSTPPSQPLAWLAGAFVVAALTGCAYVAGLRYYPEQVGRLLGQDVVLLEREVQNVVGGSKLWEDGKGKEGGWQGGQVLAEEGKVKVKEAKDVVLRAQGRGQERVEGGQRGREREMAERIEKPAKAGWGIFWAS